MEEVRVRYVPNGAAFSEIGVSPERNASDAPSSSDGPRPMVGKLLVTNQAGRICCGSDRGSGLVPGYYPSSCFAYYYGAGITRGNYDDNGLSALGVYM